MPSFRSPASTRPRQPLLGDRGDRLRAWDEARQLRGQVGPQRVGRADRRRQRERPTRRGARFLLHERRSRVQTPAVRAVEPAPAHAEACAHRPDG
jgi:hypothetical protein